MDECRILVTGGTGFIGTWVLRELQTRGLAAVALDVAPVPARWNRILGPAAAAHLPLVLGDLTDRVLLDRLFDTHAVTHVIHLAALLTPACQRDPWLACQVNILGTVALFEALRARPAQVRGLAYASSLAVYGPEVDDVPLNRGGTEGSATARSGGSENQPPTFYGATKKAVELLARQYWLHYGIRSVGLRPHVVYGPERDQGISAGPSLAARAAARGEAYTIGFTGALGYDYVEDVARAFVDLALLAPDGAPLVDLPSISATPEHIVQRLVELVPAAAGQLAVDGPPIPSNIPVVPAPLTQLLPTWQATSLDEGLRRILAFYHASPEGTAP